MERRLNATEQIFQQHQPGATYFNTPANYSTARQPRNSSGKQFEAIHHIPTVTPQSLGLSFLPAGVGRGAIERDIDHDTPFWQRDYTGVCPARLLGQPLAATVATTAATTTTTVEEIESIDPRAISFSTPSIFYPQSLSPSPEQEQDEDEELEFEPLPSLEFTGPQHRPPSSPSPIPVLSPRGIKRKRHIIRPYYPNRTFKNGFNMTFTDADGYIDVDVGYFDNSDLGETEYAEAVQLDRERRLREANTNQRRSTRARRTKEEENPTPTTSRRSSRARVVAVKKQQTEKEAAVSARRSIRNAHSGGRPVYKEPSISGSSEASEGDDDMYQERSAEQDDDEDDDGNDDDDEDDEIETVEKPERTSRAGHNLRKRAVLNKPQRMQEYVTGNDALRSVPARKGKTKKNNKGVPQSSAIKSNTTVANKPSTTRNDIRLAIYEETTKKRWAFYKHYEHLFLPLLPETNFIAKLKKQGEKTEDAELIGEANEKKEVTISEWVDNKTEQHSVPSQAVARRNEGDKIKYVPYYPLNEQPSGVKATMKPYQVTGLSFLVWLYNNGASGLLGDEMGLGKTLQTLSLFSYITEHHPSPPAHHRPFLVVCPLSVLSSWMGEIKRWVPHLNALRFHGSVQEKQRLKKETELGKYNQDGSYTRYDIVVTTYEAFEKEVSWFRRAFVWRYVVLDEGHKIKNERTHIAMALQGLSAEYRLILTGTPLQNNLKELWALLHYLMPEVFTDNTKEKFSNAFDLTNGKYDGSVLDYSRKLLELVMLRRMKNSKGVDLGLPPKKEIVISLPLTPIQRFWYKTLITRLDQATLEGLFRDAKGKEEASMKTEAEADKQAIANHKEHIKAEQGELDSSMSLEENGDAWKDAIIETTENLKQSTQWTKLMNLLMQLRKCCNHPYLLPGAEPENWGNGEHVMLASSKFILLDRLVSELCIKQGRKVLIFSYFTSALNVIEDFMVMKSDYGRIFKHLRLDGGTPRARRNLNIRLFNQVPQYRIMLISTRAGGLGINLTSASDVVMFESDWNPQADLQAQARAHRIGQTKAVTVYRLLTQGTVEEQMMGRIRKKLYLATKVTESMRTDIHSTNALAAKSKGRRGRKPKSDGDDDFDFNDAEEDEVPKLTMGQLMSLVRQGARAIAREEVDPAEMLRWDWEMMLKKCVDYTAALEGGGNGEEANVVIQKNVKKEEEERAMDDEEMAKKWLSEMEKVEARMFEGREYKKEQLSAAEEARRLMLNLDRSARREGKERTVMIQGHMVLKETVGCAQWEAVKTVAGTDERLKEVKRERRRVQEHQDYCQCCLDGGDLVLCQLCPRAYHYQCLSSVNQAKTKGGARTFFHCQQHACKDCEQNTNNAGGMLYRCRWCEDAYCEDCLDCTDVQLLGDELVEFSLLNFPVVPQATFMKCYNCIKHHEAHPADAKMCEEMEAAWIEEMRVREESLAMEQEMLEREENQKAQTEALAARAPGSIDLDLEPDSGVGTSVPTTTATSRQHSRSREREQERQEDTKKHKGTGEYLPTLSSASMARKSSASFSSSSTRKDAKPSHKQTRLKSFFTPLSTGDNKDEAIEILSDDDNGIVVVEERISTPELATLPAGGHGNNRKDNVDLAIGMPPTPDKGRSLKRNIGKRKAAELDMAEMSQSVRGSGKKGRVDLA